MYKRKFAWLPTIVETWRNSRSIVWLQFYMLDMGGHSFVALNADGYSPRKFTNRLGRLSIEIR